MDFESRFGNFITELESRIGYAFLDVTLAAQSLNHGGPDESWYLLSGERKSIPKNDRLALYGNAALYCLLAQDWFAGGWEKATWDLIRKRVLSHDSLAETGFSFGLYFCLKMAAGTPCVSKNMMVTAVEAILGAVRLDGGEDALRRVLENICLVRTLEPPATLQDSHSVYENTWS